MAVQLKHRGSVCTDLAGSAAFMAPETWSKCYQNFKSDLWAVGVVLYEMIYCDLPFHASSHPHLKIGERQPNEFCDLAYKLGTVGRGQGHQVVVQQVTVGCCSSSNNCSVNIWKQKWCVAVRWIVLFSCLGTSRVWEMMCKGVYDRIWGAGLAF